MVDHVFWARSLCAFETRGYVASSDACVSQRNAQASPHCPYRGEGGKGGQRRGLRDMPLSYRLFCGGSRDKRIQTRKFPFCQQAACGSPSRFMTKTHLERQVCLFVFYLGHEFGDVIKSVSLVCRDTFEWFPFLHVENAFNHVILCEP